AQMPGVVLRTVVNVGDSVAAGDSLLVLEAMKMEVQVSAPCSGTVSQINAAQGDHVTTGQVLALIA
ncbi:MAG: biotin/lipoyl-binding protein, partial [Planctomycetales bacterium]|nr:biotin/lipoyl-binding protein [Planctomycetales bacterium]